MGGWGGHSESEARASRGWKEKDQRRSRRERRGSGVDAAGFWGMENSPVLKKKKNLMSLCG